MQNPGHSADYSTIQYSYLKKAGTGEVGLGQKKGMVLLQWLRKTKNYKLTTLKFLKEGGTIGYDRLHRLDKANDKHKSLLPI